MHWLGRAPNPTYHAQRWCQREGMAPGWPHAPRLAFPDGEALPLTWFVLCHCTRRLMTKHTLYQCVVLVSLRTFSAAQVSIRCSLCARSCVTKADKNATLASKDTGTISTLEAGISGFGAVLWVHEPLYKPTTLGLVNSFKF